MQRKQKLFIGKAAVILAAIPVLIWAHDYGPDPGKNGVPGESNCTELQCHVGTALNGGPGSVSIAFPGGMTYLPGVKQHLKVTISDPAEHKAGFQVTARQSTNAKAQAGFLQSTDQLTLVMCSDTALFTLLELDFPNPQNCPSNKPLNYIEHSLAGASRLISSGSQTYEFDWTPPSSNVGNIVIYIDGNAANGDGTERGDHIYSKTYTLTPASFGGLPSVSANGVVSAGAFGGFTSAAPGSWIEIFGANLAASSRGWEGDDFNGASAPSLLDGVKVSIGGQSAFIDYVSPGQVNAQVPSNVSTGATQLAITTPSGTSPAYNITINPLQPGLLAPSSFAIGGKQYVVAQFGDGTFVLPPGSISGLTTRQAKPGETITIYGVGFGPVVTAANQNILAGQIVGATNQLTNALKMTFGGTSATVSYSGLASGFVGLYQFNVVVPAVANNDALPFTFTLNSVAGPQTLVTAVKN